VTPAKAESTSTAMPAMKVLQKNQPTRSPPTRNQTTVVTSTHSPMMAATPPVRRAMRPELNPAVADSTSTAMPEITVLQKNQPTDLLPNRNQNTVVISIHNPTTAAAHPPTCPTRRKSTTLSDPSIVRRRRSRLAVNCVVSSFEPLVVAFVPRLHMRVGDVSRLLWRVRRPPAGPRPSSTR
jgi:hypothetical protein